MSKETVDSAKMRQFEKFVEEQTTNTEDSYNYSESKTIINRFKNLFSGSKSRIKNAFQEFVKTKKGTCWELAMSYDYYLSNRKSNHHIVAVKTTSITCHTFNIYVEKNQLHVVDLFKNFGDKPIATYEDFRGILGRMYNRDYEEWYVLSEIKNNFSENFKRLGMKKWAKFCGETEKDGGFMVINEKEKRFDVNDSKNVKWLFSPFKFPTFG